MNTTRVRVGLLLLVALAVVAVTYGLVVVDKPRIESVENEWGAVEDDRSEVETEITVDNPRLLRVGDAATVVEYTVSLNGVQFASERKKGVDLDGQNDTVRFSTWLNNDRIPDWWVTHVNNDETTTVTVDPTVALEYGGVRLPSERWTRERTVTTDLLAPIETNQTRRFTAFDRTVLVVNETNATWGHATAERTPIDASATVTNSLPVSVSVSDVGYTIRMNGIVVGEGKTANETAIPAESTRTLETRAYIDNSRLDEWWVTHLRNDETTNLSVSFNATVAFGGLDRGITIDFITYNRTVDTDVFGSDAGENQSASVQTVVHEESQRPLAVGVESRPEAAPSDGRHFSSRLRG